MTSTTLVPIGLCPNCGRERLGDDGPDVNLPESILELLDRVERTLLAIYDDGVPATDQDRWALIGYRDALVWVLSAGLDD